MNSNTPSLPSSKSRLGRRYGWHRDLPDHRDRICMAFMPPAALPPHVDLRGPNMPAVYDQEQLGSCTANAIAAALEFDRLRQKLDDFMPSRLFIYFNERAMEGTIHSDCGAQIRDGIKSVATNGDCPESEWPYNPPLFAVKPPAPCYAHAVQHKAVNYARVPQFPASIQSCLAAGFPVVFGFTVYAGFEGDAVAQTGVLNLPQPHEANLGGHAVLAVGYDLPSQRLLVRNSWGAKWGQQGYFTMPFAYAANPNLASDFWQIQLVS